MYNRMVQAKKKIASWNDYVFQSIMVTTFPGTLLIIRNRRFYNISLPFAGNIHHGITHTYEPDLRIHSSVNLRSIAGFVLRGISSQDCNYEIPSCIAFHDYGNCTYRNNKLYSIIYRKILPTL